MSPGSRAENPFELRYNREIFIVVSIFSLTGSVAIIVTYFLWRDLQITSRKFLVYISFGDFWFVFPSLVILLRREYKNHDLSCKLQSFISTTAIMWSFFWTTSLAIFLYFALVKKRHDIAEKLMVPFHVLNWSMPLVFTVMAFFYGQLGYSHGKGTGGWCWIKVTQNNPTKSKTVLWMLVTGKLWEILSYVINSVLYFCITQAIKKDVEERSHLMSTKSLQVAEKGRGKLAFVPVIFVILRIWGTLRFLLYACSLKPPSSLEHIFVTLQVIGDNAQGITNFVLFCLLTDKFKHECLRVLGIHRRENNSKTFGKFTKYDGRKLLVEN
ncbi:G-protein coupled receptor 157-like [Xenia sp. Carnegie-2017]|uniref:G-protein coupled receptor 157-like n=1 Tax=Xenia sp. Carnegie-2017 TaxID=2897299 RepID=UPI001F03FC4E|nr:G-protein coupled receptor 157-like [Xenia sp. Carnegie-2017]